ncbi:hypothetical protein LTR36_004665 [Oleoguttula mirabilis]|uniref:GPI-anchored wall transfer protein n=1 Tax=Oleoguttula mirabilis TaxID=1507867 RepID=A0AAV9JGF4_9PEZI|nr:hypothetical protein LTR36_004665 [Oleoguttula mirabilis]
MTPEYKAEKEASVSFLGGGGIWEINAVTFIAPAAAFLWAVLQTRQSFFKPYTLAACLTDFLLHCGAILFATTVYSGSPQILLGLMFLPAIATSLQPPSKTTPQTAPSAKPEANGKATGSEDEASDTALDPLPIKPFITAYRGAMMIISCISILAVDFNVFPRRFAKTEAFGTSLMDLGVGSFVFAAGIVAARQQLKEDQSQARSFVNRMRTAMRHSTPLLALGFIRLWTVKGLDYAEHVSEYGVHWNFFFTLALLPPAIAFLQPLLRWIPSYGIFAFLFTVCYECMLWFTPDLKAYIILSERKEGDFLSQNREGVFSFIGYLAIFIAGMGVGLCILPRDPEEEEAWKPGQTRKHKVSDKDVLDEDADWLDSVIGSGVENVAEAFPEPPQFKPEFPQTTIWLLVKWTGLWFVFAVWMMWIYGPRLFVSRRMANLAYVCWVCSFNTAQLLLFAGIEQLMFPNLYNAKDRQTERQRTQFATSRVMQAFNRNGLALFLLANLLTGLTNMAVPTLHLGDVEAMAILVTYIATICGVALALDHYDVSIKL